jgi:hypothetical protein
MHLVCASAVEPGNRKLAGASKRNNSVSDALRHRVDAIRCVELVQQALVFEEIARAAAR